MVTTERYEGFLKAGMSNLFADDSLVRNSASLRLGESETEEVDDDKLQNSCEVRERIVRAGGGACGG